MQSESALRLGAEMRRLRTERGLTLQQLAQRAALSVGYLSQVERGRSNPSFAALMRVAGALNLPLSALMAGPEDAGSVDGVPDGATAASPVQAAAPMPAGHPSGIYRDRFVTPADAKTIQVLEAVLEPGDHSRVTPYVHDEEEELIFVIEGALEFRTGDQPHLLTAGQSLLVDPRIPHSYRNPGPTPVRWLWISATTAAHSHRD